MHRFFIQHRRTLALLLLAFLVVGIKTFLQLHVGFSLADESYLWYGMQRTVHGEVPLRDFMAYDPGRYYWGAAGMWAMGSEGLIAMRIANAAFQVLSLFWGLWLLAQATSRNAWPYLVLGAVVLVQWMTPAFKVYDHGASIMLVCSLAYLVQAPSVKRYFVAAIVLGLLAFVGRNHGLYGVMGTGLAVLYLYLRGSEVPIGKAFLYWLGGLVLGYSPAILMMLFVPGFTDASLDMIRIILGVGRTNLPKPVPWPWGPQPPANYPLEWKVSGLLMGYFFIAILAFAAGSLAYVFARRLKGRPVSAPLVACSCLALPYAHFAFSRADQSHLTFGGIPLFLGMLIAMRRFGVAAQTAFAALFCIATFLVVTPLGPWKWDDTPVNVAGAEVKVMYSTATDVRMLQELQRTYAPGGQSVYVVPFWPGAYPLLGVRSPAWDLYSLFPRTEEFQQKEIERIEKAHPAFVLIIDAPPDENAELLFRNTNPLIWKYIQERYRPAGIKLPNPKARLFLPREAP